MPGTADLVGFALSFLAQVLLQKCNLKITLLIFAAIMFTIPGPAIFLRQERTSDPLPRRLSVADLPQSPIRRCIANDIYKRPVFYLPTILNLVLAFGFYLPFIYLPSFVTDLGYSAREDTLILAISNFAQIIGEVSFGKLPDRKPVPSLEPGSSLVAAIASLTLWDLSRSRILLAFFSLVFGTFASGLISLWARIGIFFGEKEAQNIYSVMSLGRGIRNIASAPINVALLKPAGPMDRHTYALGKYKGIVLYTGFCMAVSSPLGGIGFFAVAYEKMT